MGKGVFVGGGAFRVDHGRALEMLRAHQLDAESSRMALWVRTAVLRGASRMEFKWRDRSLTIGFDGRPFSGKELADPFSELLEGAPSPASRWFALALLHTAVPDVGVRVESGPVGSRRCLLLDRSSVRAAAPAAKAGETVVTVDWPMITGLYADRRHPYGWDTMTLRPLLEPCPVRVVSGHCHTSYRWRFDPVRIDRRGVRNAEIKQGTMRLLLRLRPGKAGLSVRFCQAGVEVCGGEDLPSLLPLHAWVDDPALPLDASLTAMVRGEAYLRTVNAVQEAAQGYILSLIRLHDRAMRLAGRLISSTSALRRRWARQSRRPLKDLCAVLLQEQPPRRYFDPLISLLNPASGDARRIDECAALAAHLRAAADAFLATPEADASDEVKSALWKTPLFFDDQDRPLSFSDLSR